MTRSLLILGCCAALAFAASAGAQEPTRLPPEAYGRLPVVADAAISPDGTKIALAMSQEDLSFISVYDLAQRRSVFRARVQEETQLRGVGFADDQYVSYTMSRTFHPGEVLPPYMRFVGRPRRVDYVRQGVVELATQEMRLLSTRNDDAEAWQDQNSYLVAPIEGDPGYGRMIGRAPGLETVRDTVYRVNLATGRSRLATVNGDNEDTRDYVLDERGAVAVRVDSDNRTNRWRVFVYDAAEPRLLIENVSDTGAAINIAGLMADGRLASVADDETGEFFRLYAINRTNAQREVVFERQGFEVTGAITDPWTRRVVGVGWTEEVRKQQFFEPALQAAYEAVGRAFPEGTAELRSWSRDRSRILVYAEQGLDGGGYYVFTPADNSVGRIAMRYPELAQSQRGVRQSITYRARDGVRIPAYLTLPTLDAARNLPLVVLVHGGPHGSRDHLEFDYEAAFLASRGYAVLQPNFRGSGGYGRAWQEAGRRQWGGLMQTDVEDGVAGLVRAGMVDAARICIAGASYGGYAALAGATLTPDRYKCAISIAGVSDLVEMLRYDEAVSGGADTMVADHWRLSIGDRQEDRERIRSVSPANLVDRVRIPILLMHGTDDTIVPIDQSRRMHSRLRDAGKPVRFVELRGDDHWLSDAATRIQTLREMETFLAEHIGRPAQ